MEDPASTYQTILHNIAALGRLERQIVADISKLAKASQERIERIHLLQAVGNYRTALQTHAQTFRRRLLAELTGSGRRTFAQDMKPLTEADFEELHRLAEQNDEAGADETEAIEARRRKDLEADYFALANVRQLPAEFRRRIGPV